jgi:signal transduction histidine kinase
MQRLKTIVMPLLAVGLLAAQGRAAPADARLADMSLPELEQLRRDIDTELEQLAAVTLRGGVGSLGYRSKIYLEPNNTEWIRIELDKEVPIDQVVLSPMLFRGSQTGLRAEGFPIAFRILAGTGQSTNEVAVFTAADHVMPRAAPLAASFPPVYASWVELEVNVLSKRIYDNQYVLQLSEIQVFSGMDNVALHQKVIIPPDRRDHDPSRKKQFLVDGFTPYIMDAAQGAQSRTVPVYVKATDPLPSLTIDLAASYPIHQVNLHTAGEALSIPTGSLASWSVPQHVRVWGSHQPDFSDSLLLCEYLHEEIYDSGPILRRRFPEQECRYVRIEIVDYTPIIPAKISPANRIAFSEIEVLSNGRNVAENAPVIANITMNCPQEALEDMTNGRNYFGNILPTRSWMMQLARRHDLETARPLVLAELKQRYERQKTNLKRVSWLAGFLFFGSAITILTVRFFHLRRLTRMKERLAADLHDELGANLHTIGLLSDMAEEARDHPDEQSVYHQRIRKVTERSGKAMRNVADLLESNELFTGLKADMQRAAERIMARLEHDFSIEGEDILQQLKPRTRADLFLFYKECLINIYRHSEATRFATRLTATPKEIVLKVTDNGRGMPDAEPPSLKRRARLLKAKLSIENPELGGTSITLRLRT